MNSRDNSIYELLEQMYSEIEDNSEDDIETIEEFEQELRELTKIISTRLKPKQKLNETIL